ncbi:vacuolar protein-sorting-associated protein [Anaeramoeba ignava]|uniref:Vacuolar protein-sorting-associated protein 36 n=1 Tax=Anaeramoeba ignava TaxID=1746090 RepID=A0A9Q0L8X7_ANAIG|nr:vacuolar protein-sorting-associated protein [Anaeramoeba ignava]
MQFFTQLSIEKGKTSFELEKEEYQILTQKDVSIHNGKEKKPKLKGVIYLTSKRLAIIDYSKRKGFSTFLSIVKKTNLEKSTFSHSKVIINFGEDKFVTFSFKSNATKFAEKLVETLSNKTWVPKIVKEEKEVTSKDVTPKFGIEFLLQRENQERDSEKKLLTQAFTDLDALMKNAQKMVNIAEKFAYALHKGETDGGKQETDEFNSILIEIGMVDPVTKETSGDIYYDELSRQVASFLEKVLPKTGGMISLADAYCLFNRARGTELISPDDLLKACQLFQKLGASMDLRKFDSGVIVIQSKSNNDEANCKTIIHLIQKNGPISPFELAKKLKISINLAKEQLLNAESNLFLCRDETIEGLYFYENFFLNENVDNLDQKNLSINENIPKEKKETSKKETSKKETFVTINGEDDEWQFV